MPLYYMLYGSICLICAIFLFGKSRYLIQIGLIFFLIGFFTWLFRITLSKIKMSERHPNFFRALGRKWGAFIHKRKLQKRE